MATTCDAAVPTFKHTPLPLPADRTIPLKFVVPSASELPDPTQTTAPVGRERSAKLEEAMVSVPDEEVSIRPVVAVVLVSDAIRPLIAAVPPPVSEIIAFPAKVIFVADEKVARRREPVPLTTTNENA
jgi:hypothetical protein